MISEVELTDDWITLRPCRPSDADAVYVAIRESIPEVSKWAPWCPPDYSMSHCKPWLGSRPDAWSEGKEFDFVILDAHDGVFLGGCALNDINRMHNFANLGYWIRTSRTGQGIATAATRLVAENKDGAKKALTEAWGADYDKNMEAAQSVVKRFATKEAVAELFDSNLGNLPGVSEMFHAMSVAMAEGTAPRSDGEGPKVDPKAPGQFSHIEAFMKEQGRS